MSVLLEYVSQQPVSASVASAIQAEQLALLQQRRYWSEPLSVVLEGPAPARLVGGHSLFNSGGYETQSGQWMEVSQEEDYLMAWSDTRFVVEWLANWSREHGLAWSVYSAGDHIGDVSGGVADQGLLDFLEGLLEASSLQPGDVPAVDEKFANRYEPPQAAATSPEPSAVAPGKKPWWRVW